MNQNCRHVGPATERSDLPDPAPRLLGLQVPVRHPGDPPADRGPHQAGRRGEQRQPGEARPGAPGPRVGPAARRPPAHGGVHDDDRGHRQRHGAREPERDDDQRHPAVVPAQEQQQGARDEEQRQRLGVGDLQHRRGREDADQRDRRQREAGTRRDRPRCPADDRAVDREHRAGAQDEGEQRRDDLPRAAREDHQAAGEQREQREEGPRVLLDQAVLVHRQLRRVAVLGDVLVPGAVEHQADEREVVRVLGRPPGLLPGGWPPTGTPPW